MNPRLAVYALGLALVVAVLVILGIALHDAFAAVDGLTESLR